MNEERKQPFIRQEAQEKALFSRLQAHTLEEVQRMSGNGWTDYNVHDPGVTLADVANYGLAELDYKLGFPLADYLTREDGVFDPGRHGLFLPRDVYTTTPVTTEDYRRLMLNNIPEIEDIMVEWDDGQCGYDIRFTPSPFEDDNEAYIINRIREIYHAHRNLCEQLKNVSPIHREKLEFQAELEMKPGGDATLLLARIYATILRYLSGDAHIFTPEERLTTGLSPEEWLEGSEDGTRLEMETLHRTEYGLYKRLIETEGVQAFSICYLMMDGKPQSDFSAGYGLNIPTEKSDLKVRIFCGRTEMVVDFKRFLSLLRTIYYTRRRAKAKDVDAKDINWPLPQTTYRDIFTQTPIAHDFPLCYGLTENREKPTSFDAYLKLYDWVARKGLDEVKELPQLFSIREEDRPADRRQERLKSRYLDFLDGLYGVESQPGWLNEFGNYGESPQETLLRRMAFLRSSAGLTKCRSKARNMTDIRFENNVAEVKKWFCLLLGANMNEDHAAGNVLPSYNLRLFEENESELEALEAESTLIEERMLDADKVMLIDVGIARNDGDTRDDCERLRQDLPIFNENKISGDLFRNGTRIDNYRVVDAGDGYYMLVFRNQERKGWTNLGRDRNRKKLNLLAVVLRRFLWKLNRDSETLYVFEPVLVDETRPFELDMVLPAWTYRFHSARFREMCGELLRSIIPAHITYNLYWLDQRQMQTFEKCYHELMKAVANGDMKKYESVLYQTIGNLFESIH